MHIERPSGPMMSGGRTSRSIRRSRSSSKEYISWVFVVTMALQSVMGVSRAHAQGEDSAAMTAETSAQTSAADPQSTLWQRTRLALPLEVSVIGLTVGLRPELLYQPFAEAPWLELRAAAGVLPGAEYIATPVSLGVRGRYLDVPVHPLLGMAFTQDIYWITDASPILRGIWETDVGLSVDVHPEWSIDAIAYSGWGVVGEPGPLAGLRLGLRYTPAEGS